MKPFIALALAALFSSADAQSVDYSSDMLQIINEKRAARSLNKVCVNSKVVAAAQKHAEEMAAHNYVSVTGLDGTTPSQRLAKQKFQVHIASELVGAGQTSASKMLQVWMQSSDTYFYKDYTHIGVGYKYNATQQYKTYWVIDLAQGIDESCNA